MAFIDEVVIRVHSGAGGNGCISFRREKYVPFGGPNGGNGGRGGSVFLVPTINKNSLLDFKYQPVYKGERGQHGMGKDCDGRSGKDLFIEVPMGTVVIDPKTNDALYDLTEEGVAQEIAVGGQGGRGNKAFATSTLRAPRVATPGQPGENKEFKLELRLLADVGLVGLPNAGKSSFLRTVSRAHPKVADYPFTTLEPNLGVLKRHDQQIIFADLPGLIEGASVGHGLGHKFLKHVSRNRLLLHLVDANQDVEAIAHDIQIIDRELCEYDLDLSDREKIMVFNKIDQLSPGEQESKAKSLKTMGYQGFWLSNHTREGHGDLLDLLAEKAQKWNTPADKELDEEAQEGLTVISDESTSITSPTDDSL